jgi:hypothetical protein
LLEDRFGPGDTVKVIARDGELAFRRKRKTKQAVEDTPPEPEKKGNPAT